MWALKTPRLHAVHPPEIHETHARLDRLAKRLALLLGQQVIARVVGVRHAGRDAAVGKVADAPARRAPFGVVGRDVHGVAHAFVPDLLVARKDVAPREDSRPPAHLPGQCLAGPFGELLDLWRFRLFGRRQAFLFGHEFHADQLARVADHFLRPGVVLRAFTQCLESVGPHQQARVRGRNLLEHRFRRHRFKDLRSRLDAEREGFRPLRALAFHRRVAPVPRSRLQRLMDIVERVVQAFGGDRLVLREGRIAR